MEFEVNWMIVCLRVVDGFLYGTGFVLAILLWLSLFERLAKIGVNKHADKP